MSNYADHITEDRRLVVLRMLEKAAQYSANAFLIRRFCERVGHAVGADRIEQDLAWLAEQGLVKVDRREDVTVAELTVRGLDVAGGRTKVPGVQTPMPGG